MRTSCLQYHDHKKASKYAAQGSQVGFTLIEVIVAMVIFSVITVACFNGLTFILDYEERERLYYQDQNRMQRTWNIVLQDLLHIRTRTERDRLGGVTRAYETDIDEYLLLITRGGFPSITGTEGGLQRVAYSVDEEGQFLRWTWPRLDLYNKESPSSQVLMGGVGSVEFWQLNSANEFEQNWPPLNEQLANDALPKLIKFVIELENGERVERLVPGVEMASSAANSRSLGGGGNPSGTGGSNSAVGNSTTGGATTGGGGGPGNGNGTGNGSGDGSGNGDEGGEE